MKPGCDEDRAYEGESQVHPRPRQNWRSVLRDDDNKTELFQFLADRICQTQTTSTIIVTKEGCVICSDNQKSLEAVSPCLHKEADTRIFVHARDAAIEGNKALVVKANDTDIVVITVYVGTITAAGD